ncbi:MAG: pyridoxamine 5'-phosphate oxidase [Bacteroidales bacterium]
MSTKKKLFEFRQNYTQGGLSLNQVLPDPLAQFNLWFDQAVYAELPEPNAMTLATAGSYGRVSARVVLLKEVDTTGFVFYTNYNSRKGRDIKENPNASLVFLWLELERQVRIEGILEKVSEQESDEYFRSRPRESQLGAWSSDQSREIASREMLHETFAKIEKQFEGKEIPRPSHWGGYRLVPDRIEFWQGRPGRLHDRILYRIADPDKGWERVRLAP